MRLHILLQGELHKRQARNCRYSLRAFARDLTVHHSNLSRILRGLQRVSEATRCAIAARLRLPAEVAFQSGLEELDAVVLDVVDRPDFRSDTRWIATMTGIPADDVNIALHRLLRRGFLRMAAPDAWERLPKVARSIPRS